LTTSLATEVRFMLDQLTLDDIEKQHFRGFAEKIPVERIMLACSACKNYVSKDHVSCPRCGSLFVGGL
jgi:rRNA maturation endonuclease Nob1